MLFTAQPLKMIEFATKDFLKPTAEGRQFINGKSHHPKTTFKSILFGEAIRLRHLNRRIE